jgi:hypothetical protein
MKLKSWTHDYWLFGGTAGVVTSLAHFQNIPQLNCQLTLTSSLSVSTISSDILLGSSNHGLLLGHLILHEHSTPTMKG